ncbi:ArsR family transcriptional regulator [Streptomyces zinciresistens K42]|uniref:ArsR family transcriptional regulator n=1 Tax=Streptomyces zinciresistens K42 TaxID=700597 RepID=G2GGN6_9ACTN|nr:DUF5937 family protein [Streptomyces zinciresistens]EGX57331.1 ArsR family transcriptional regulator [Streptomyces zinciresistens K42]
MSVVLQLSGAGAAHIRAGASPLAELTAALHAYTEAEHHPSTVRWARGLDEVSAVAPRSVLEPALRQRIMAAAPLWATYRARYLLPMDARVDRCLSDELDAVADLPLPVFAELTGYAVRGGNSGAPLDRVLHDPAQRRSLLAAAELRSTTRTDLARRLLDDPDALRRHLLALLAEAAAVFEAELGAAARTVSARLPGLRSDLSRSGAGPALARLDPSAVHRESPSRVVFDKFHHGIVNVAATGLVVVPSVFGRPHVLVKHEPGAIAVIQYPVVPEGSEQPGYAMVNQRLDVLRDPARQRIARAIAREPLTPSELAARSGMTLPQVSRHLGRLREADLVIVVRDGRRAYYQLSLEPVRRIGEDLLAALFR